MHAPSWPTSFGLRVTNPARTIEEAWREYACGKPAGDGKRSYRYGLLRLEGEPSLWAALDRLDASNDGEHEQATGTSPKKTLISPIRHLQIFGRPSCSVTNPEHANALA